LEEVKYKKHIVICGWSRVTVQLLDTLLAWHSGETLESLLAKHHECVIIGELDPAVMGDLIEKYRKIGLKYVRGDWTMDMILRRAGVQHAATVIVVPDEGLKDPAAMDQKTVLSALTIKAINPKARLITQIMLSDNRAFLQHANADEVLLSDEYTGFLLATHSIATGIPYAFKEMFSLQGEGKISLLDIPEQFIGKKVDELSRFLAAKRMIFLGLSRRENPMEAADILSADSSALDDFIKRKFEEAGRNTMAESRTKVRINPLSDTVLDDRDQVLVIGDASNLKL